MANNNHWPSGRPYEWGLFFFTIHFSLEYPFRPPRGILHPNINKLHVFYPLLVTATWRTGTAVKEVLQALHDMLLHPKVDEDDHFLVDVARMCVLEPERYEKEACLITEEHAMN
ncbi:hypothetical protein EUTSA_v10000429mg [Eutrema salsugineum]|uniref:UBC core domain-containing protein n=1 Tax=Eutrema salsugineum TaxID=72664 RepID=V4NIW7_EUTSA|nr:ubiquitin-conjugating enzyme E2 D2 [Eutrema salsugineum]ESQ46211.1 hypothetical protein EUTSA_v10000429mg [Eutrema salsugineum]